MTQKEKLVKLIEDSINKWNFYLYHFDDERLYNDASEEKKKSFEEFISDYLLENGVIVPPCKVGDTVWLVIVEKENNDWYILEDVVDRFVRYDRIQFVFDMKRFGYLHVDRESNNLIDSLYDGCICSTKEEAEKALAEKRTDND